MKILISARRFTSPFTGGVDVYVDRFSRELQKRGHEVALMSFDARPDQQDDPILVSEDAYEGKRVWRFALALDQRPAEVFQLGYDPLMGQRVKAVLEAETPDLLVVANFYLVTLAIVEAARDLGIPVVHIATDFLPVCRRATLIRWDGSSCQVGESIKTCSECFVSQHTLGRFGAAALNVLPEGVLLNLAERRVFRPNPLSLLNPYWKQVRLMRERLDLLGPLRNSIEMVFAPTKYTAQMFVENGFRDEQVHYMPFGVEPDHPLTRISHTSADHTRFLFVGRLQPYKGVHLLVEAFNSLSNPRGAKLTVHGVADGHDAYFLELKAKMEANDRIRFLGVIPPQELGRAFAETDYFLLPSTWHENSPLIVLDALQSHTPVIASDIGGVRDIVTDGVDGLLFPMGDVGALRQTLQQVIDHPELVEEFRSGMALPSIESYVESFLSLCSERGIIPTRQSTQNKKVPVS